MSFEVYIWKYKMAFYENGKKNKMWKISRSNRNENSQRVIRHIIILFILT